MDKYICKICNKEIEANNHFYRQHKLREADYYTTYEKRFSKQTGELIKFKSRNFYLHNDFNDKREFSNWLKEHPSEGKDYVIELLIKRKEAGKIIYAPSSVELSSLMMPSMKWFKQNFESYNNLCESIGLIPRFNENKKIEYRKLTNEYIIKDTREQKAYNFDGYNTLFTKLDFGDYTLQPYKFKVYIERKTLGDLINTISEYNRFIREIERAKRKGAYLVIIVESKLSMALNFNYIPSMKYILKSTPDFLFHRLRELMQTYLNIQFVFINTRKEAENFTFKILTMKCHPKNFDLQYLYSINEI